MKQQAGHHLAEFNLGVLKYDWDDPRIADFANNLTLVNEIAERSPGYIWHLPGDEMEAAQMDPDGPLGGNPRIASTLSVWESRDHLGNFVWKTVHKKFYDRRDEWYGPQGGPRLVMWWVPIGHRPDLQEAMQRYNKFDQLGATDEAFNWAYID